MSLLFLHQQISRERLTKLLLKCQQLNFQAEILNLVQKLKLELFLHGTVVKLL